MTGAALAIEHLTVALDGGERPTLHDVSLAVEPGEALGIIGGSGAGKTTLTLAALGLLPAAARLTGSIRLLGEELVGLDDRALGRLRGRTLSIVFQDPAAALNPVQPVGWQVDEAVLAHQPIDRHAARRRTLDLLDRLGMPAPDHLVGRLPSELSGGQRQRIAVAIALANDPDVVIADEPTSDLDTIAQAQVLDALDAGRREAGAALLLISHDLAVVAGRVDRVVVLDHGTVVEAGPVADIFADPRSDVTRRLLAHHAPRDRPVLVAPAEPVLDGERLVRHLTPARPRGSATLHAVCDVTLSLLPGRTLGLVGESGSGKSSIVQMLVGLVPPSAGEVRFRGIPVAGMRRAARRQVRADVQVVFQDPYRSLDPRMTVAAIVGEPLRIHRRFGAGGPARVRELLGLVDLDPAMAGRRPHQLSTGERQRVAIARALALDPAVLVLDEPVSSLDATTCDQVLDLLTELQQRIGFAALLVSHDLGVIARMADVVAVLHAGKVVESGPTAALLADPRHPCTVALLGAVPTLAPGGRRRPTLLVGEPPSPLDPPSGCRFRPRCPIWGELPEAERSRCEDEPPLAGAGEGHQVACHFPLRPRDPMASGAEVP